MTIAMEECAETAQRISKALRFGLDEIQPGQLETNRLRIRNEYRDLTATLEMVDRFLVTLSGPAMAQKKAKVEKYLKYSKQIGRLS